MVKKKPKLDPNTVFALSVPAPDGSELFSIPGEVVESLRQLAARLGRGGEFPRRLALVAALRGEGVTFLSRSLAATLAYDTHASVCWVDLNWWWPSTLPVCQAHEKGLADVLSREITVEEAVCTTGWSNLAYLPAGALVPESRPVMARSKDLQRVIDYLSRLYDHLILDIPAVLATSDAVHLAALGTACCVVIMQGVTFMEDVKRALDEVEHLPVLGTVLNQVDYKTPQQVVHLLNS